ncbi:Guided entry of tail-anchored proteins factor 1 [Caenorhabditis elegans]|nr:Guided entry of tail-anchored proteins factor 1 [Caenorhabditis elegans]CCD67101.1 Guided entry of tail-anchored proteins factor 1 [Caenorhabditis elegans]|eukprot:NP_001255994.1 WRB (human W(tryptophan)-Rich Basic nuclear protein) homolog [Caenorhabditis elegans]
MDESKPVQISIFNVIAVICSATFAIYSSQIVSTISSTIKSLSKPKPSPKVVALKLKIADLKRELHGISPTAEFARYFKKDREMNKASEELAALEAASPSENSRNLKIDTVVKVFMQFSALFLLRHVSAITAYCIPDTIFWPFNVLVRFPAVFGNDSCPAEFAEVSGFALTFLMIHLLNLALKTFRKSDLKTD